MISKQLTSLSTFAFKFTIGFGLRDITIPSPIYALSSVHHVPIYNKISKILKKMWVFYPHCILMLPSSVPRTVPGPLDLYKPYGSIPELFEFPVQNAYQMHLKSAFLLHPNHIPINKMISIRYIFLEKRYMEYIMNRHRCMKCNHISYWTNHL
jgi:hypothetical protein